MSSLTETQRAMNRAQAEQYLNRAQLAEWARVESVRNAIADQRPEWVKVPDMIPESVLASTPSSALPTDDAARKAIPIVTGCYDYFPAALVAVALVSKAGNDQHNPGQPMHHARGKSMDHANCAGRHLQERGTIDTDGQRHTAKAAWRILALLQQELEDAGEAPLARGARLPK